MGNFSLYFLYLFSSYHLPEQEEKILQELTDKKLKNQIDRENYSILDLLR